MKVWPFMVYTIIGCMAYGGLMVYVSNAPFLIMEKGVCRVIRLQSFLRSIRWD